MSSSETLLIHRRYFESFRNKFVTSNVSLELKTSTIIFIALVNEHYQKEKNIYPTKSYFIF